MRRPEDVSKSSSASAGRAKSVSFESQRSGAHAQLREGLLWSNKGKEGGWLKMFRGRRRRRATLLRLAFAFCARGRARSLPAL